MKWAAAALLFVATSTHAAEFSLYAIKSPTIMNWSTPSSLLSTAMRSALSRASHQIGHAYVGFKCDGENEVLSGMTNGPGFSSRSDLLKRGHGLSVLIQDNAGRVQFHDEVVQDIAKFSKTNRMAAFKMKITNDQCLDMKAWYAEYTRREPIIYGGVDKRPLLGEGAGCSAYVMSFMEHANVDYDFFNGLFEKTIHLPQELLGGQHGERRVGLLAIYRNKKNLSIATATSKEVKLYDPNTMYLWIQKKYDEIKKSGHPRDLPEYDAKISKINKTKVLILDKK